MEWLHFFNHAHEEKKETMEQHYTNPMIFVKIKDLTPTVDSFLMSIMRLSEL